MCPQLLELGVLVGMIPQQGVQVLLERPARITVCGDLVQSLHALIGQSVTGVDHGMKLIFRTMEIGPVERVVPVVALGTVSFSGVLQRHSWSGQRGRDQRCRISTIEMICILQSAVRLISCCICTSFPILVCHDHGGFVVHRQPWSVVKAREGLGLGSVACEFWEIDLFMLIIVRATRMILPSLEVGSLV